MREMMIRLKYSGERHLGAVLAEMAVGEWETLPAHGETVTCVPCSRRTLRKRGYNQVNLIARNVCRLTGGRFADLLTRAPGPSQVGLTAMERRRNLSGVFRVSSGVPPGRVWLLDDVRATGETIAHARLALLEGGASEVVCLAVNFRETRAGSMLRPGEEERETAGRED
jgi:competence protein ComFC